MPDARPTATDAPLRQRGAAALEFSAAAAALLLAGLGAIDIARWLLVRQAVDLALLEAARAGSVAHARPQAIAGAFEDALLPLFVPPGPHPSARARMRAAAQALRRRTGLEPWSLEILSPSADGYADFGVRRADGRLAIPNDYLAERHAARRTGPGRDGRGPRSGLTLFEANVLRLRVTYLHAPMTPGMRGLLRRLAGPGNGYADLARRRAGLLPIVREIGLLMQSDAVQDKHAAGPPAAPPVPPCAAAECGAGDPAPPRPPGTEPAPLPGPFPSPAPPALDDASPPADADAGGDADLCGTVLCCVE